MADIDRQVRERGARVEDIAAALRAKGIEVTSENLKKVLYRYRRKAAVIAAAPETPAPAVDLVRAKVVTASPATPPPPKAAEKPPSPGPLRFDDLMDAKKRDAFAEQYVTSPRRRLGQKKEG